MQRSIKSICLSVDLSICTSITHHPRTEACSPGCFLGTAQIWMEKLLWIPSMVLACLSGTHPCVEWLRTEYSLPAMETHGDLWACRTWPADHRQRLSGKAPGRAAHVFPCGRASGLAYRILMWSNDIQCKLFRTSKCDPFEIIQDTCIAPEPLHEEVTNGVFAEWHCACQPASAALHWHCGC